MTTIRAGSMIGDTTLAALGAVGDDINAAGKYKHKLLADENGRVWRAQGALAASAWRALDDPAGVEDITPS